ncbi:hypothetical protein JRC04_21655 [Mycolicibacterium sp. S2-37]|uniref:hypothetical protein n=1 Tax=Mycolicibacterium sp. S2-37 TaxID=2810297 RepID=UPI001A9529A0|nr:hypothetical protein [Mycolicibacterium sp. S2-37]MBO0680080.1 hypothetical protein [Mycolicibacterium sp. S2-37]
MTCPGLATVDLAHEGNEASDLVHVDNQALLDAHGWDLGFWTVLDEGSVEDCIAVLGHARGAARGSGWEIHPLPAVAGKEQGRTEDAEAVARHEGWIYVVGSHYGSKGGPLQAKRAFIARFDEQSIDRTVTEAELPIEIRRNRFRLHRLINDALDASRVVAITPGDGVRTRFIARTIERGIQRNKTWVDRLTERDVPINIEGAAFRPNGNLLLALRFPTTAEGEPILVEVSGVPAMFDGGTEPTVVRVWELAGVAPPDALVGFRALSHSGNDSYDAILGSIDATDKGSALLEEYPQGGVAHCSHWRFTLPADDAESTVVRADLIRDFPDLRNVEGLAVESDHVYYVTDEDHRIQVRFD